MLGRLLGETARRAETGVREDGVQLSELFERGRDRRFLGGKIGDVGRNGQSVVVAELRDERVELVFRARRERDNLPIRTVPGAAQEIKCLPMRSKTKLCAGATAYQ
jgi:hypothetical protein